MRLSFPVTGGLRPTLTEFAPDGQPTVLFGLTLTPVSGKATRTLGVWQGSAAAQAQEMVPDGVIVIAALHTVSAPVLGDPEAKLDEDVLICGDRKADKARVARLLELVSGLRAVNAGPPSRHGRTVGAAEPAEVRGVDDAVAVEVEVPDVRRLPR